MDHLPELITIENDPTENEAKIQKLYAAIKQFKKIDRSIILLYLEENSYEEIAELTGLTPSNIGAKISRLKKKLFQTLKEMGYGG